MESKHWFWKYLLDFERQSLIQRDSFITKCIDQLSEPYSGYNREKCVRNAIVFTQQTKTCVPAETLISRGKKTWVCGQVPSKQNQVFCCCIIRMFRFFLSCSFFVVTSTYSRPVWKWTANDLGSGHERKLLAFALHHIQWQ